MSDPIDLTGRWTGTYLQNNREFPIEAELSLAGGRLTGRMRDVETDRESSVFEAAADAGLPPGADERIEAMVREMLPEAPGNPVRVFSHLPSDSLLEGTVEGRTVTFLKRYQGVHFGGYQLGASVVVGEERPGHEVHYLGRLSDDGREIDGRWWIDADPEDGVLRVQGSFTLRAAGPTA